jgi:heme/copper-type cytochrome/quinol oxidase subunit 2
VSNGNNPRGDYWNRFSSFVASPAFFNFAWRLLVFAILLLAIAALAWLIISGDITAENLKDNALIRGLLTIILFVAVVVLITVLVLAALFADNDESTQKRVTLCREVVSPLVAVLGTIIGFYFGVNATDAPPKPDSTGSSRAADATESSTPAAQTPAATTPESSLLTPDANDEANP